MNMDRVQKSLGIALILSETSHVFCCVLPTLFSILSLAAGLGMITAMPSGLAEFHHMMHKYEVPMISLSGLIVLAGWGIHHTAVKLDCHDTGCVHEPCGPRKRKAGKVLRVATTLFFFNITIWLVFHQGMEAIMHYFS